MEADVLTYDKLMEAIGLIKALAPPEAPRGTFCIKGSTGLNIIKNDILPSNTIIVSKDLFDLLYHSK